MGDSRKDYCNVCSKTIITKHSVSERFSKNKKLSVKAEEHFEWFQTKCAYLMSPHPEALKFFELKRQTYQVTNLYA